ncbi:MAG: type II secretion system protein GspM [Thermodesulfovibrionales bacterium]|nr:type II secretion system protein GspM [Thermodesulfovibrionales bacterium]
MKKSKLLRFLIPLVVILLGLVIYQYGYLTVEEELRVLEETTTLKQKTLERYIQIIAEKPELEKTLASLKELKKSEAVKLIEGQTLSLAAASMQDMVKGIITSRGGTISSERVGKTEDLGNFKVINISLDIVVPDTRALSDIIYSIETRTPYLVVKELDARVRNFKEPRDLIVKLDVMALTEVKKG